MKLNGITVEPRWDWTPEYRKTVAAHFRALSGPPAGMKDQGQKGRTLAHHRAVQYARWIAKRDGIDLSEANETRVDFRYVDTGRTRRQTYRMRAHNTGAVVYENSRSVGGADTRPASVRFVYSTKGYQWHGSAKRGHYVEVGEETVIAEIPIPHWDHVPHSEGCEHDDDCNRIPIAA